ncbi:hypothetical protein BDY24DRAFT_404328 [Mrakia frigida]|uniref:uncharacterized protein n=1 Tax=Mrakia frigida TaxID=29902 RepID=UPI003FCC1FA0
MLAPPVVIPVPVPEPAAPVPLMLPPKIVPKPAGEVELTKEVISILENLWHTFPEILRQSPGAPLEAFLSPAETLTLLQTLSSLPPPPPPSSSSLSLASTSTPQHPPTTQGVLLAHLFLLLLASKETSYTLTMGQVKRGVVERVKEGLSKNAGGAAGAVEVEEGGVTKVVYWGVGKRGLVIKRGGGEAKVGFA